MRYTTVSLVSVFLLAACGGGSSGGVSPLTGVRANNAPIAESQSLSTDEDTMLSAVLSARDPDGDGLTFILDYAPANGQVTLDVGGQFSYTQVLTLAVTIASPTMSAMARQTPLWRWSL